MAVLCCVSASRSPGVTSTVLGMALCWPCPVLVVEADISNTLNDDRFVYYRFKWVDAGGMQVGDGESWKQLKVMGQQVQTVKAVAPNSNGADFRLEFNVE